jgi:lipoprotein-releasing system permease protein
VKRRGGPLAWALAIAPASALALALTATVLAQPPLLDALRAPERRALLFTAIAVFTLLAGFSLLLGVRTLRAQRGTPGRLRLGLLGYGAFVFGAANALGLGLLSWISDKLPIGAPVTLEDTLWLLPSGYRGAVVLIATLLAASAVVVVGSLIGAWFLLPQVVRRVVFIAVDVLALCAFVLLSLRYDFTPVRLTPEALTGASLRLLATLLLSVRLFIRALPWMLTAIERINFRTLVAARHLRAKKSGFLAAISFLSILAVSVSSCALTTTLSVMGGFRQDLKRKILGNNAHIVVDRPEGKLPQYGPLATRVRGVEGVRGVSPYVSGEVMISSASNLAGAVLRGIDLDHIGEVSDLPRTMRVGSLDYLASPEKLKNLPANQLGLNVTPPKSARADAESEVKPGKTARLTDELEDALRGSDPPARVNGAPALPGIVVGQELARSLRLYLGDEVNVVTPLGELGPTGPMPKSRPFRVAGIFYSGMYEYDMKFAYVTIAAAQRFLSANESASGIEITVREPDRAQEIATHIGRVVGGGLRVRPWQELNRNLFGALALEKLAMFIALGIAILVASFCIIGTLTLMVQEKGREVAVLKAMGAADSAIVSIFVLEGTLIGVLGSLLGLGFGYAMCFAAEHFGVRLNPEVYYIDKLPVHIDSTEFFTVAIAATLVSLLVTIYPAKLASRLRPVDALRYE